MPTMWLSDTQKTGIAFCSAGGFFLVGGMILFFDRAMLAMGNILFLIGLTILIGPQKTLAFFARKQKVKGSVAFFFGLFLIVMRWAIVGFLVEMYGIFVLFGDFIGTILRFMRNIPIIGPVLGAAIDKIGIGSNLSLPV